MPRGNANWIHANLSAPLPASGEAVTLGFAPDALPRFADAAAARRCAAEIIALLRRYGIEAELREATAEG